MRIDAYNAINQIYNTKKTKNVGSTSYKGGTDKVEISSFGQAYQAAKKAVAETSDIRADRVAEAKARLANGEYDLDDETLADMLINKYFGAN
ncbi:MAG: flagellar biosynthesis anti-sigma factor FlgM [Lachnospiraceae bacterium]|nr:flagellar biosynthesis anti-sigma factor FlgM [Lachnospiraceae bacterium]